MKINQIYICVLLFLLCSIANGHCSKKIIATKKLYHGFNKLECDILDRIKESKLVYDIELIKYLGLDTNYIGENRNVYIYSKYQLYDSISILIVSDSYVNSNAADYNIISFKNCKRISSLYIRLVGDTEREIGVSEYSDFEMFNNTLVQKVNYKVKTVIKNNQYIDSVINKYYTYYKISPNGSFKLLTNNKEFSVTRENKEFSYKIFSEMDLKKYNAKELRIIRNEIFADYGYIFKSDDLRAYFSKKEWYNPRYNDVTSKLTDVEKYNINLILEAERDPVERSEK